MVDLFGGAVSGLVKVILEKLGSAAYKELGRFAGVKDELRKLENILSAISAVLLDAEEQQSNNNTVSNWLTNLKDVVYDIEDVLDLISIKDLERKVKPKNISRILIKPFSRYKLVQELKSIEHRLDQIWENRRKYNFREQRALPIVARDAQQRETHSFIQESQVFGREEDIEHVVSHILSSSCHEVQQFSVIPIIGIGGMGKTTLAKLVWADPRIVQHFKQRLWAYVSKNFDLKTIIENIIQSATGQKFSNLNLEALKNQLHAILTGQTFLLVLDDVWVEDPKQWMELKELLAVGSRSAIIVTSREERVASVTGTTELYKLKELPEDHCWSIFVKYAFNEHEEEGYPSLVQIGKSIIRKCRGVPLAVRTLGSLLRHERDYLKWKQIEGSQLWKIEQRATDILPALKLSFDHTPYYLRSCFACCAMFPKGFLLYRSDLINLWMAQGLLQSREGSEDAIDVGYRYYNELLSRSFFQLPGHSIRKKYAILLVENFNWIHGLVNHSQMPDEDAISQGFRGFDGKVVCAEMHDLMHDLAAYVAGEEIAAVSSTSNEIPARVRHIVWDREDLSGKEFPVGLLKAKKARSCSFLAGMGYISSSFLDSLLSNLKFLRILILLNSEFCELPDSIGDLKHLTYLELRRNSQLKSLPCSICKLVNLKILNVSYCGRLQALPKFVHNLVNLRILMLTLTLTRLPKRGFLGWSSLQVLKFIFCPNLISLPEEFENLKSLRILVFRVCDNLVHLPNSMSNLTHLEHITIHSCNNLDLIEWKGLRHLRSLRFLVIYNLPKLVQFPDGIESAAASLHYFRISECASLRSLPEGLKHCTSLLKLQIFNCPELSSLPRGIHGLRAMQELRILGCPELSSRCERDIGEDWQLVSHVPKMYIDQIRNPPTLQGGTGSF